ncbi:transketolase [Candidatus Gottesmanbacteria bacterium]|nr:transketolase [Candidatus Gottesmanbacteria bacterium]
MKDNPKYIKLAKNIRRKIVKISHQAKVGHVGSAYSIVEILIALYFGIMKIDKKTIKDDNRDRFILSKGHAAPALYAVLHEKGLLTDKNLAYYCRDNSIFEEHPKHHIEAIEVSTGSLGHGLSIGAGLAMGGKLKKQKSNVFVLMSDAECDEGEVWEAALFAGHHKLSNLLLFLDYNKVQALGTTKDVLDLEPLAKKWQSFGWKAVEVDGHNTNALISAWMNNSSSGPTIYICHTTRGKGVSFMENVIDWHYKNPDETDLKKSLEELI